MSARARSKLDRHYRARYAVDAPLPARAIAEEDARIAESALARGEVAHALHALAGALLVDPFDADWQALLDRAIALDPAELEASAACEPQDGFAALRAYASAQRGELEAAVGALTDLASAPELRFLEAWALPWLLVRGAVDAAGPKTAMQALQALSRRYPDVPAASARGEPPPGAASLGDALTILADIETCTGPSDEAAVLRGILLARAGRLEEAISVTAAVAEARPTTMTLTAAAMANRRAGKREAALVWFRRAADAEPTYAGCLLDMGDLCLELGDFHRALAAYEEALARVPDQDWAHPSAEYCRVRTTGSSAALAALRTMANGAQCTCGGAAALAAIRGGYSYDDRQKRAEHLMRILEPDFVRRPVEIVH